MEEKLTDWRFGKFIDCSLFKQRVHFNDIYENFAEHFFGATRKCVYRSLSYLIIRAEILIQCIAIVAERIAIVAERIALVATPYFMISVVLSQRYAYNCDHDSLCIVLKRYDKFPPFDKSWRHQ